MKLPIILTLLATAVQLLGVASLVPFRGAPSLGCYLVLVGLFVFVAAVVILYGKLVDLLYYKRAYDLLATSVQGEEEEEEEDPHPNRKKIEDGIKAGRQWQYKLKGAAQWGDPVIPGAQSSWNSSLDFRLAPGPEWVALEMGDLLPHTVIRRIGWPCGNFVVVTSASSGGCRSADLPFSWRRLEEGYEMNQSIPLCGKWIDTPEHWVRCRKLSTEARA